MVPIDLGKVFVYFDFMASPNAEEPAEPRFTVANLFVAVKDCMLWEVEVGETMTVTEAAAFLGVSKQRVIQLVNAERLRSAKFGRNTFVPLADVVAYRKMVASGDSVGGRGHKALPAF